MNINEFKSDVQHSLSRYESVTPTDIVNARMCVQSLNKSKEDFKMFISECQKYNFLDISTYFELYDYIENCYWWYRDKIHFVVVGLPSGHILERV